MVTIYYGEIDIPIGKLLILTDGEQLYRIDYGSFSENESKVMKWLEKHIPHTSLVHDEAKVAPIKDQLVAYFQKDRKEFTFRFAFYGTAFQKKVWQTLVEEIPFGKAKTYKDIAIAIGNPKAVRAVGGAVNKNPFSIVVPCHRVLGSDGRLVGYNGGLDKKEYLLKHEEILS
ncbi:methylated-DNA--[protein]-cysteine S-methyltransferase [Ornithinibacillus sp. BX22]|uniref:Methylated-DNA--protein-cysteine methyltransferase n=2 Tax=Ornithinibacillus TaxID=484508 RepID=A0A923L4Y4_9BACI|nr:MULTISPECIES: methylated-DNA--[protein]-cysteine S-methyltransferase [Ornithinibacillus]MBC5636552.1 methylated-DNA--[protein]-cysteine S-methyltransferase [Ornithinibacillus hominis]MBS3680606.1 methylated-DNA--[protein]-cysteine S-methyltransferase [Ornithinibacillus massiliensis]